MAYDFGSKKEGTAESTVNRKALCGSLVKDAPVPTWTSIEEAKPFITLEDPCTKKQIGFNKYHLARGVLLLGAAGSGKTNVNMMFLSRILQLLEEEGIVFIFDTKGDYLKEYIGKIPASSVCVVGSGEEYEEITSYWNIFAEIMSHDTDERLIYDSKKCDERALEIATMIFREMKSELQPAFPMMAIQIFTALLVNFMKKHWKNSPEKLNNKEFLEFMFQLEGEDIKQILEQPEMKHYRAMVSYIHGGKSGNQTQGVLSILQGVTREMLVGPFAESDEGRTFSIREIFEGKKKTVIFLEYDLMRGETLSPIYSMFIDLLLKHALGGRTEKRKDTYLVIDEWGVFKTRLKHMADTLSFGRSQGVKLIAGLQNYNMLSAVYEEADAKSIIAGFQTVIGFHVTDAESRQFLSERAGRNYQNITFLSNNQNREAQREGYALEDWDIQQLECGEAMVKLPGEEAFLFSFPEYEKWKSRKENCYVE